MSELLKTSDDTEPSENLSTENNSSAANDEEASSTVESDKPNDIETNAISSAAAADEIRDINAIEEISNQINQKNSDEAITTTTTTSDEEDRNADATQSHNNEVTKAEITIETTKTTTTTTTATTTTMADEITKATTETPTETAASSIITQANPSDTPPSNITQAIPSTTPEAIKMPSKTTEQNQITKDDAKACETTHGNENLTQEPNDNAEETVTERISEDSETTKASAVITTEEIEGTVAPTAKSSTASITASTTASANSSTNASANPSITAPTDPSSDASKTSSTTFSTTSSTSSSTVDPNNEYAEHITYTEDGSAIYTDPKTDHKYKWSAKENNWLYWKSGEKLTQSNATNVAYTATATATSTNNPYENEHYRWCSEKNQWIPKDAAAQQVTVDNTQTETEHYKWDATKNAWIPKHQTQQAAGNATAAATASAESSTQPAAVTYGIHEDGQRIYTDKDGVVFFWDAEKSAWFPKIDDDFMARYQMNYGFIDNTSASEEERRRKEEEAEVQKQLELQEMVREARAATEATAAAGGATAAGAAAGAGGVKRKATQEPPSWFDLNPEQNTKVYVSNLPLDITIDEFAEIMSKCGMIMRDPKTQKHKLKLYSEVDGQLKGDGLCDYIKIESVELALKILDEYEVRDHKIRVQRAKFQMRGEYNPALKPKRKKKDKEKLQKMKEKLFDWRPEKMRGERTKNEKVVIIKNLFTPELFEKEVQLILDYQNDLREECSKCGMVRKVVIYDMHPEGVAQINMGSPEEADLVIQMMHGRYFGKRQLTAEHWDGKTKYKIAESETAVKSRLNNWDEFLEKEEEANKSTSTIEAANS